MLSPGESYLKVGAIYGYMTAKLKVGNRVRILSTLKRKDFNEIGIDENIDKYIGKIDIIEYDDGEYYHLENCGMWFPGSMLELVEEKAGQRVDQCSVTIKKVGGGSCISGSMGINEDEFNELWARFIDGRV